MRSFFPLINTAMLDPAVLAARVPHDPVHNLIVLARSTKVMRAARVDRRGHHWPAVFAPHLICTHRPRGKAWPKHRTNRVRKAVA